VSAATYAMDNHSVMAKYLRSMSIAASMASAVATPASRERVGLDAGASDAGPARHSAQAPREPSPQSKAELRGIAPVGVTVEWPGGGVPNLRSDAGRELCCRDANVRAGCCIR